MSFDWKSVVSTIAPVLGTAIGGPFGGMAAKVIGSVLLNKGDATEDEIMAAIQTATPEQLHKLKSANNEFKLEMAKLGVTKEKMVFDDKDSARRREVEVKDNTPKVLAYFITTLFALALAGLYFFEIPEGNKATIYLMLGSLGTLTVGAYAYYHGSSQSSARKDILFKK